MPKHLGGLGIRKTADSNLACFMNTVWRLWSDNHSLLAKSFKGKYYSNTNIWAATSKATDNALWKYLLRARNAITPHLQSIIGKGHNLSFWDDKWYGPSTLRSLLIGSLNRDWSTWSVSDFICPVSHSWNIQKLQMVLPRYLSDLVLSIPLTENQTADKPFWPLSKGYCSVSFAYHVLTMSNNQHTMNWNWI